MVNTCRSWAFVLHRTSEVIYLLRRLGGGNIEFLTQYYFQFNQTYFNYGFYSSMYSFSILLILSLNFCFEVNLNRTFCMLVLFFTMTQCIVSKLDLITTISVRNYDLDLHL